MKRIALVGFVAFMTLAGCSTKFPYGTSWDRHNFVSTAHMPLTLTLVDTVTGDTVWALDIPVGKQAVVDFEHDQDWTAAQSPATPASSMRWQILDLDSAIANLENEEQLSGNPVLLKVSVRELAQATEPVPVKATDVQ
jgi:hypothetical protein